MTKDKIQHALINLGIVAVFSLLWCPKSAIAIALIVSVAKEIYDEYKTNATGFDTQDLIADCIGIILGLLTFLIIHYGKMVL